jgi:hypothetical protein
MNKNCTTGTAMMSENKPSLKMLKKRQRQISTTTSGCLYVTHVNLYLHPNSNVEQPNSTTSTMLDDSMPKVKSQCCNPDCFYYDSEILGDYYYCCNPGCYCFKPDWYYYL